MISYRTTEYILELVGRIYKLYLTHKNFTKRCNCQYTMLSIGYTMTKLLMKKKCSSDYALPFVVSIDLLFF